MESHSVTCHPTEVRIQPKHVLDLATPEGCKAELTYVMWKPTGRESNPRPDCSMYVRKVMSSLCWTQKIATTEKKTIMNENAMWAHVLRSDAASVFSSYLKSVLTKSSWISWVQNVICYKIVAPTTLSKSVMNGMCRDLLLRRPWVDFLEPTDTLCAATASVLAVIYRRRLEWRVIRL